MPTLPFGLSILNKIKSRSQATKWTLTLREVIQFRAYCCDIDSDAIMGIAKEPVPIIHISPIVVCLGEIIGWDISDSYAPGSTLTSWSIDFGDGDSESGINFPGDTTSGSHTYAAEGTYDVVVTIEEGGGKSQTSQVEITVIDCTVTSSVAYCSTDGEGVWKIDFDSASPDWLPINVGLEGDSLFVRSLILHNNPPNSPTTNHKLKIATKGGVYFSDNGGQGWYKIQFPDPSNAEFGDTTPATVEELDWHHIVLDPNDTTTIYVLASKP